METTKVNVPRIKMGQNGTEWDRKNTCVCVWAGGGWMPSDNNAVNETEEMLGRKHLGEMISFTPLFPSVPLLVLCLWAFTTFLFHIYTIELKISLQKVIYIRWDNYSLLLITWWWEHLSNCSRNYSSVFELSTRR